MGCELVTRIDAGCTSSVWFVQAAIEVRCVVDNFSYGVRHRGDESSDSRRYVVLAVGSRLLAGYYSFLLLLLLLRAAR